MEVIEAHCHEDRSPSVEEFVEILKRRFPETTITSEDRFEKRREELRRLLQKRRNAGNPIQHPDMLMDDIDRAEAKCGPEKNIEVIVGTGVVLRGSIGSGGMLLRSDSLDLAPLREFVDFVQRLPFVKDAELLGKK